MGAQVVDPVLIIPAFLRLDDSGALVIRRRVDQVMCRDLETARLIK